MLLGQIALEEGKPRRRWRLRSSRGAAPAKNQPALPRLNFFRGDCLARLGRADEAEAAFLTEIKPFRPTRSRTKT